MIDIRAAISAAKETGYKIEHIDHLKKPLKVCRFTMAEEVKICEGVTYEHDVDVVVSRFKTDGKTAHIVAFNAKNGRARICIIGNQPKTVCIEGSSSLCRKNLRHFVWKGLREQRFNPHGVEWV